MKTIHVLYGGALGLVLAFVTGCAPTGPSNTLIEQTFQEKLNEHDLKLTSFQVTATQNDGTKVEPLFRSRVHAEAILAHPRYKILERVEGHDVLKMVENPSKLEITGISVAVLKGEKWQVQVERAEFSVRIAGQPQDYWGANAVLEGSSEAKAAYAERDRKLEEARLAALRKQEEEQRQNDEIRKTLTGVWCTLNPIMENGVYARFKNGGAILYSIAFPGSGGSAGIAQVSIIDESDPSMGIQVSARYSIQNGGVLLHENEEREFSGWRTGDEWGLYVESGRLVARQLNHGQNSSFTLERLDPRKTKTPRQIKFAQLREELAGTWVSVGPMKRNGQPYLLV